MAPCFFVPASHNALEQAYSFLPKKRDMNEYPRTQMMDRLWEQQLNHGFITDEAIKQLASDFNIAEIEVEGVVSFYHFFHRKPTGKYTIYLNNSIVADHKGFNRIKETLERETGAIIGSTDRTGTFGLFLTPASASAIRSHLC